MKMTILHTETLKRWGGQQNRVLEEAVGLGNRGHRAIIACHRGSILAERAGKAGVKVYEMNMVKNGHLKTVPKLMNIIKSERVDIVSTHSSVDSWAGGLAAKLSGRRLVRFRHNLFPIGWDPLTKFIYSIPDRIVTVSNAVTDVLLKCRVRRKKLVIIPDSVDIKRFKPGAGDIREELKIPDKAVIIGNTSTFSQVKGQEHLLQAFNIIAKEHPCYLLFAGVPDEFTRQGYIRYVNEDLRDKVIFLGYRDDVPKVLNTIDIFVYPSFLEGLGTALIEAMIMARPIALSDIPTFREFIENRVNGLFFKAKDPDDIANKVLELMANKGLQEQLAVNARETALEKFTLEKMMDLTEANYEEVINAV